MGAPAPSIFWHTVHIHNGSVQHNRVCHEQSFGIPPVLNEVWPNGPFFVLLSPQSVSRSKALLPKGRNREASKTLVHLDTILRTTLQRRAPEKVSARVRDHAGDAAPVGAQTNAAEKKKRRSVTLERCRRIAVDGETNFDKSICTLIVKRGTQCMSDRSRFLAGARRSIFIS